MSAAPRPTARRVRSARSRAVIVREMELDDLPDVFALGERLFTAEKWPTLYRTWDDYELAGLFAADGETCMVAESDSEVVGFALGTLIEKRRGAWSYGYLLWLGVDPRFERRGVASRLVNHIQDVFIELGARMMIADTDAENDRALAFLRRQGYAGETAHVYLSKNLTRDIEARERRRARRQRMRGALRLPVPPEDEE